MVLLRVTLATSKSYGIGWLNIFHNPFGSRNTCVIAGKVCIPAGVEICSCRFASDQGFFMWHNIKILLNEVSYSGSTLRKAYENSTFNGKIGGVLFVSLLKRCRTLAVGYTPSSAILNFRNLVVLWSRRE